MLTTLSSRRAEPHFSSRATVLAALATLATGALVQRPAAAHHSTAEYRATEYVEARGEIVSVLWRNPHVRLQISTKSIDGNERLWELESSEVTRIVRAGVSSDIVRVGDTVRFAGNPSSRSERRMYLTNLLIADGREFVFRNNVAPRWAPDRVINTDGRPPPVLAGDPSTNRNFFGRVFILTRGTAAPDWVENLPLTAAARARKEAYDEVVDDPTLGCVPPGMPRAMLRAGPYGFRFVERGSDIVLELEFFALERVIHMDGKALPADQPDTPLGYSVGKWEGVSLVITTTHIDWPYFESYSFVGVPQSRAMQFVERVTPTDGGVRLKYDFAASDPAALTQTVSWENYMTFQWQPTVDFLPYDCVEERTPRNSR